MLVSYFSILESQLAIVKNVEQVVTGRASMEVWTDCFADWCCDESCGMLRSTRLIGAICRANYLVAV